MMKIVGGVRLLIVEHSLTEHALQTNNFVVVYDATIVASGHSIDQLEMFFPSQYLLIKNEILRF